MSFKAAIPNDICRVIHRLQQSKFVNFLIYVSTLIRSTGLPLFSLPTMEVWECQLLLNNFQQLNDENTSLSTIVSNNRMTRIAAKAQSFPTIEWREYQLGRNHCHRIRVLSPFLLQLSPLRDICTKETVLPNLSAGKHEREKGCQRYCPLRLNI